MKKLQIIVLLVLALVLFTGCKKKKEETEPASSSESQSSSSSVSASDMSQSMAESASIVPEPILLEGTFISLNEEKYTAERAPRLILQKDGTGKFIVNTGEPGNASFTGEYELVGKKLTLTVNDREGDDFLGKDLLALSFTMVDDDHFTYSGEPAGLTRADDQFTREGKEPLSQAPQTSSIADSSVGASLQQASSSTSQSK